MREGGGEVDLGIVNLHVFSLATSICFYSMLFLGLHLEFPKCIVFIDFAFFSGSGFKGFVALGFRV